MSEAKIIIGCATWNNKDLVKNFIESTSKFTVPYDLCIWSNGSTDGTNEMLDSFKGNKNLPFLRCLTLHFNPTNDGMVIPWNFILGHFILSDYDFAFICNDDIRFTHSINKIIDFMKNNPQYGMVCPAVLPKGTDPEQSDLQGDLFCAQHNGKIDEGGLEGPCMILPRNTVQTVGFFDPTLKNSFNDMDYHQRVHKAGMKSAVYYGSCIWHLGGASTGKNPDCQNKEYYEIFQRKHG